MESAAVGLGFLVDPFAEHFVRGQQRAAGRNAPRRPPVINRGTYVRTMALDRLMEGFIASMTNSGPPSSRRSIQVVSLGAGTDTRYFVKVNEISKRSTFLLTTRVLFRNHHVRYPAQVLSIATLKLISRRSLLKRRR